MTTSNEHNNAPAVPQGRPFGHFRAEPFGWTDCAATDDGAIALYEHPMTNPWRDAVIEQLESWHIYVPAIHDNSPRLAIKALVNMECKAALDPAVSSEAAALAAQGVQAHTPAVPQTVYLVENRTCLLAYASREDADKAVASMPASVGGGFLVSPVQVFGAPSPTPAPAQERCSTCGYLTSEREHLGCLRRAVKDLDIATGGPYDAQGVGLTDEEIEAIAKKHMSTVGDHWSNEEAIREIHAEDFARDIIAALRAKESK